jgi:hypothetical protein
MHLTYDIDEKELLKGTRQKLIDNALAVYRAQDRAGEIVLPVHNNQFGDALFSYIQALLKITDVSYLSRERVRSTFMDDFRTFISEKVPAQRYEFDWHDPNHDPQAKYTVDCRINRMHRPLFIYALPNDDHTRDATIAILQFEKWNLTFNTLAIFEEQEEISRKVLARFTDVCQKEFSSLTGAKDRIVRFLEESLRSTDS